MKPPECDYDNYDGKSYEEDKATFKKVSQGGPKSRVSWGFADIPDDRWPFKKKTKSK